MANIITRPDWHISDRLITPEKVYWKRRKFLKELGFLGLGLAGLPAIVNAADAAKPAGKSYPYPRNPAFNPGWALSNEHVAATYNNFYEFSTTKDRVWKLVSDFVISPWTIEIGGLVDKPMKLDMRELIQTMPLEERVYRFRCVEAWAMIVPWTGFPLKKLIEKVSPKAEAKFVRFQSFNRPDQAPGMKRLAGYPWPYTEGLRIEEAMNDLVLVTTGIYGKPLPKQHGAPVRIIVPWKYGYKSIKSVERIDFVSHQPATLWETLAPDEYPFESNVNPAVPHPRWSQATERMIDTDDRVRTLPYNGYGAQVAALYKKG